METKSSEDIEQLYETWTKCFDKIFSVSLIEVFNGNCNMIKTDKEQAMYVYETQIGKAKKGFRHELKKLANKYNLDKIFNDSHEFLDFTLLIAELSKLDPSLF